MGAQWTEDQRRVIDSRERNLLVAAAAGSGKTAVLVERIIRMVTDRDHPAELGRLLVMTFTNAAAAEMRERIGAAVEKALERQPDSVHLQRQAALLAQAPITTIDSFCLQLIRENFDRLSMDPMFRIGDEGELLLLQGEVLDELLEDEYAGGDQEFSAFVETFALGKSDDEVKDYIMQVWRFSQSSPWPDQWLADCRAELMGLESLRGGGTKDSPWMAFMVNDIYTQAGEWAAALREAEEICGEENGPAAYLPMIAADRRRMEELKKIAEAGDLAAFLGWAKTSAFDRLAAVRGKDVDQEKKELVSGIRTRIKKSTEKLLSLYALGDEETVISDLLGSRPALLTLLRLAGEFAARYQEAKRERNLVDFGDLEHFALQVLTEEGPDGGRVPGPVADELARHYEEILVDEYQDSNMVQETLIQCICGERFGRPNVFMVGDVKQSIYKFRLACPELFLRKYKTYSEAESDHQKIELHKNFRSRAQVLESVNQIFYGIMTESLGGVAYTDAAALHPGAVFPPLPCDQDNGTELLLLNAGTEAMKALDDDAADVTARELEARMVGERIRELTGQAGGLKVWDKERGEYRTARYSDIVILLRSVSGWSEVMTEELGRMGIPAFAESKTGYFTALEVETVLNILAVLDNPMQDIPLTSVLKSPVGGLTDRELAEIMAAYGGDLKKGEEDGMYQAVCRFLSAERADADGAHGAGERDGAGETDTGRKLRRVMDLLDGLREQVPFLPMHSLLYKIYDETGYYDYVAAMPAGKVRQANLDMLVERAASYESGSFKGLFHFIKYIEQLKRYNSDFGEASAISEQDNTVRIVSIHKSKGLEYPIVILAGMAKSFNKMDARGKLLIDGDFGVASDYLDIETRLKAVTLKKNVLKRKSELDSLGEELRILYVAMTRAKEKLIMTAADRYLDSRLEKWSAAPGEGRQAPFTLLSSAGSYLDWVVMAMARPGYGGASVLPGGDLSEDSQARRPVIAVREIAAADLLELEVESRTENIITKDFLMNFDTDRVYDRELLGQLERAFSFQYPHEADLGLYAKMTVSELKREDQALDEEESCHLLGKEPAAEEEEEKEKKKKKEEEKEGGGPGSEGEQNEKQESGPVPILPAFMEQRTGAVTAVSRGTAYHRMMERLPFESIKGPGDIEDYVRQLAAGGYIDEKLLETFRPQELERFLNSSIGRRMRRADIRGELHREQQFVVGIPAREIGAGDSDELVLIQGIIDAWFDEGDGIVLLDYKTDFVRGGQEELLRRRYRTQLHYYKRALEQMLQRPVKEMIIYSFRLGEIPVEDV